MNKLVPVTFLLWALKESRVYDYDVEEALVGGRVYSFRCPSHHLKVQVAGLKSETQRYPAELNQLHVAWNRFGLLMRQETVSIRSIDRPLKDHRSAV